MTVDRERLRAVALAADTQQRTREAGRRLVKFIDSEMDALVRFAKVAEEWGFEVRFVKDQRIDQLERVAEPDDLPDGYGWTRGHEARGTVHHTVIAAGEVYAHLITYHDPTDGAPAFADELADVLVRHIAHIGGAT